MRCSRYFSSSISSFFGTNPLKIAEGGWVPLVVGAAIFVVMTTWHDGMDAIHRRQDSDAVTIAHFVRRLRDNKIPRLPGSAIFSPACAADPPPLIADHVRQMGGLYEEVVALTVRLFIRPRVGPTPHHVEHLGAGFWHVTVRFGFIEVPDVDRALHRKNRLSDRRDNAIYFSERDFVVARKHKPRMAAWRRACSHFSIAMRSIRPIASTCRPPTSCRSPGASRFERKLQHAALIGYDPGGDRALKNRRRRYAPARRRFEKRARGCPRRV